MKRVLLIISFFLVLISCRKNAEISITNNIANMKIEKISFNDISIEESLLPGETANRVIFDLPQKGEIKFYMTKNGLKVLLHTKEKFALYKGGHLKVILDNNTEVYNPINKSVQIQTLEEYFD